MIKEKRGLCESTVYLRFCVTKQKEVRSYSLILHIFVYALINTAMIDKW